MRGSKQSPQQEASSSRLPCNDTSRVSSDINDHGHRNAGCCVKPQCHGHSMQAAHPNMAVGIGAVGGRPCTAVHICTTPKDGAASLGPFTAPALCPSCTACREANCQHISARRSSNTLLLDQAQHAAINVHKRGAHINTPHTKWHTYMPHQSNITY
jgi:hypothetical protein